MWQSLTLALLVYGAGACGRTDLDAFATPFQSETTGGVSATGGTTNAGRGGSGGGAATSGASGSFMVGGAPGTAGGFGTSGSIGTAGAPGKMCELSLSDCRTEDQVECAGIPLCEGKLSYFNRLSDLANVHVVDVTTSTDGRVAIAGYFRATLRYESNRDGGPFDLLEGSSDLDAFVATLDSTGKVLWALAYGGAGDQRATGLDFAPSGGLVFQGKDREQGFVVGVDADGTRRWSKPFPAYELEPGQVVFDNDGVATLSGRFEQTIAYDNVRVDTQFRLPYLIRIDQDGNLLAIRAAPVEGVNLVLMHRIAIDDEDRLIIAGWGYDGRDEVDGFVLKLEPRTDEVIYMREITGTFMRVNALTVDREMRVTFGGDFQGDLSFMGKSLVAGNGQRRVWAAQLDRNGELNWLYRFGDDEQPLVGLLAITADTAGNLLLFGDSSRGLYLQKLRTKGAGVWLRLNDATHVEDLAIASDNDRNSWIAGSFSGDLDLGAVQSNALGQSDGFVAKIAP